MNTRDMGDHWEVWVEREEQRKGRRRQREACPMSQSCLPKTDSGFCLCSFCSHSLSLRNSC